MGLFFTLFYVYRFTLAHDTNLAGAYVSATIFLMVDHVAPIGLSVAALTVCLERPMVDIIRGMTVVAGHVAYLVIDLGFLFVDIPTVVTLGAGDLFMSIIQGEFGFLVIKSRFTETFRGMAIFTLLPETLFMDFFIVLFVTCKTGRLFRLSLQGCSLVALLAGGFGVNTEQLVFLLTVMVANFRQKRFPALFGTTHHMT